MRGYSSIPHPTTDFDEYLDIGCRKLQPDAQPNGLANKNLQYSSVSMVEEPPVSGEYNGWALEMQPLPYELQLVACGNLRSSCGFVHDCRVYGYINKTFLIDKD